MQKQLTLVILSILIFYGNDSAEGSDQAFCSCFGTYFFHLGGIFVDHILPGFTQFISLPSVYAKVYSNHCFLLYILEIGMFL